MKTNLGFMTFDFRLLIGGRRFVSALTAALLLIIARFAIADPAPEPRLSGVRELSAEALADFHARMFVLTPERTTLAPLSARHLNIAHLPAVRSQGALGSCAAFASTYYYKTYQEARERGWVRPNPNTHPERVASPMWSYNLCHQQKVNGEWAISHYDALALFCDRGAATWADMPYADTNDIHRIPDDPEVWRRAMRWRAAEMGRIPDIDSPAGLSLLKRHLADGDPAVVAIRRGSITHTFDAYPASTGSNGVHNGVLFRDHGTPRTRNSHGLTVLGYDDNREYTDDRTGETRRGALLLVNSWGTGWGINVTEAGSAGFIWIAYDYVLDGGLGREALIMRDRVAYEPTYVAMVGIDYPSGTALAKNAFDLNTVRGRQRIFPFINATGRVEQIFPVDISDLLVPPVSSIEMVTLHFEGATGTLTDWWVETYGGEFLMASDDVPFDTEYMIFQWAYIHSIRPLTNHVEKFRYGSGSAAFADVNANGKPDLIVTGRKFESGVTGGSATTRLWMNEGDGTFTPGTAVFPGTRRGAVVWSDVNNNGAPDLWLGGETDTRLYYNDGAGNFSDSGLRLPPAQAGYLAAADYNRDGRPDLALATTNGVFVYRRNPDGTFTPIVLDQRGVYSFAGGTPGTLAWGDSNGNGLPDLIVSGVGDQHPAQTVMYRNLGYDRFEITAIELPHLLMGTVAWTDFDNDGHDDLAVSGQEPATGRAAIRLFRGGGGAFVAMEPPSGPLPGLERGAMYWVDLDHSGRRDLLISGREMDYDPLPPVWPPGYEYPEDTYPNRVWILRNMGRDIFEEAACKLPGVSGLLAPPPLAVADITGDGSVDLFAAGTRARAFENQGHRVGGYLARNLSAAFPSHGGSNTPPTSPTVFNAVSQGDGAVTFTWSGATDDVTPEPGLRYILRLGTGPGAGDIASGIVQPYDWGNVVRSGVTYRDLPADTLHWSVRTVDSGLRLSPWSPSQSVTVPAYTPRVTLRLESNPGYGGATDPATDVQVTRNSALTVTALTAPGFVFSHWGGDAPAGTTANPLVWTVTEGALLSAHFVPKPNPRAPAWIETPDPEMWGFIGAIGAGLTAFNNRLYLMGWQRSGMWYNMVLYSEAGGGYALGDQWRWTDNHIYAPWPARSHHGVEVFNNRMWVIGGQGASDALLNDVWSSADGINWNEEAAAAPWTPRYHASTTVYDNKLWLLAGRNAAHQRLPEVWNSANGRDWMAVTTNAPWGTINRSQALLFDNRIFLLVGKSFSPGEVWTSADGVEWNRLTDRAPWVERFRAVAYDGRIVVTVGTDATTEHAGNAVWESLDGIAWLRTAPRTGAAHWPVRDEQSLAVADGRIWQVGGRRDHSHWGYVDVWSYGAQPLADGDGELRLSATPYNGGMLTPPAGTYVDAIGSVMTVSAEPAAAYLFDGWDGPVSHPSAATTTVTLARFTAVNARFVPEDDDTTVPRFVLSMAVAPVGAGTTVPAVGEHNVTRGTRVTLRAVPAPGYRFDHWDGPVVDPHLPLTTVRPVSNTTVTANFRSQSLAAGQAHTALVRRDGTLWVWGQGWAGQSGRGAGMTVTGLPPLAERGGVGHVAAGRAATAVTMPDGTALIWGAPWTANRPAENEWEVEPRALSITDRRIARIAAGSETALLLADDGTLWRSDSFHQSQGLSNVAAVSVGPNHNLAVDAAGIVWGWGGNADGEIDPDRSIFIQDPAPVPGLPPVRAVAAAGDIVSGGRSYAIDWQGHVWRWGAGLAAPEQIDGLPAIVDLSAGIKHTLALDADGRVHAWGDNTFGQCGDGTYDPRTVPGIVGGLTSIVEIAAGAYHGVALDADGRVHAWGDDSNGAVSGTPGDPVLIPIEIAAMHVAETAVNVTLTADPDYGGAVVPRRPLYHGRIGSVFPLRAVPAERYQFTSWQGLVADLRMPETSVTIMHPVAITCLFDLRYDADARLTLGVIPPGAGTTIPAAGVYDAPQGTVMPIRADHAHRWRFNRWQGEVEDPTARATRVTLQTDKYVDAVFEPLPFQTVPALSTWSHELLLLYADSVVRNAVRTVHPFNRYATTIVQRDAGQGPLSNIVQVVRRNHHLALSADGTVFAWGQNNRGQCGLGFQSISVSAPRPVLGTGSEPVLRGIRQVAGGRESSLALDVNGGILQWGTISGYGHAVTNRPVPLLKAGGEPFDGAIAIDASRWILSGLAAAVRNDGSLWTWDAVTAPAPVAGIANARAVSIGVAHTLVLLANGTVRAWGDNQYGQLGNGTTNAAAAPVTVHGLSGVIAVAAGNEHSLALTANGRVYAWGRNEHGQVGDGTRVDRATPVLIGGLTGIKAIDAGWNSGYALAQDGSLYYWGAIFSTHASAATPTPIADAYCNVGVMDAQVVRLTLGINPDPSAGSVFPGTGIFSYNRGQTIELRATPAEDYRLLRWSDGNTNLWREITLNTDLDLTAEFILIEPTIRLEHVWTGPGMTARMRVLMEDGKQPYAGFNAAILLPPGVGLHDVRHGIDLAEGFRLDTVTRRAPGGGTLLSLVAFSPDEAMDARDGEWAILTLRAGLDAAGGALPVIWVAGRAWTRCPPSVLSDVEGLVTVRPTLIPGSITVDVAHRVHAALRVVAHPAAVNRMSDSVFNTYLNRTHYVAEEAYTAEIWLRVTGTGTAGIVNARLNLEIHDFDEAHAPIVYGTPVHGILFGANTGSTVDGAALREFGGATHTSTGEGRNEWVRLGWVPVTAPRDAVPKSVFLQFGEHPPALSSGAVLSDMTVLGGPVMVRTLAELPRAAQGTPHWWLDAYGLVELGVLGYDEAETTDYRGDGFIAREAYIAGVDPTDMNSRFIIAEIARGENRDEISWPGVAGRRYRVYRATTLTPPADWSLMHTEKCFENRIITYPYTHGLDAPRFYRIDVDLLP